MVSRVDLVRKHLETVTFEELCVGGDESEVIDRRCRGQESIGRVFVGKGDLATTKGDFKGESGLAQR